VIDEKMFPIQGHTDPETRIRILAGQVPWSVAEQAYKAYAVRHERQSLEMLARRGGFGWGELVQLLRGPNHYVGHECSLPECWSDPPNRYNSQ